MVSVAKEASTQAPNDYFSVDATVARSAIIGETIIFCTLALLGGGLFTLVAITNINWYYPTVFYGVVVYIAWQRYFSVNLVAEQVTQQTTQQREATQLAATAAE